MAEVWILCMVGAFLAKPPLAYDAAGHAAVTPFSHAQDGRVAYPAPKDC
jgi:cytochrome bd-type quinol oxidase subunit 2